MERPQLVSRSLALICACALALPVMAQSGPSASTRAALAVTSAQEVGDPTAGKQQDSAAALFEQAAYAEEHERDLKKAKELYFRALQAANVAKDGELVRKTMDALTKLGARTQAAAPGGSYGPVEDQENPDAILQRIGALMDSVTRAADDHELDQARRDLALFGDAAAPWVKLATLQDVRVGDNWIASNPQRFVEVLAAMESAGATAAMEELARSADPLVRRTLASEASPQRHRELLLALLQDPAQSVRESALRTLAYYPGEDLAPIMRTAARAGEKSAIWWLMRWRPAEGLALLGDAGAGDKIHEIVLDDCTGVDLPPSPQLAGALLDYARSSARDTLRRNALLALQELLYNEWRDAPAELRDRIETDLAANLDSLPQPESWKLLLTIGGPRSLEPLMATLVSTFRTTDLLQMGQYSEVMRLLGTFSARDFPSLTAAIASVPANPQGGLQSNTGAFKVLYSALIVFVSTDLEPEVIVQGLERMRGEARDAYLDFAADWLRNEIQRTETDPRPDVAGRLDPALLPLVRALALSPSTRTVLKERAADAYGALGDPELLGELLLLQGSIWSHVASPVGKIFERAPEQALAATQRALDAAMRRSPADRVAALRWLEVLPSELVLPLFRRYWPQVDDDDSRVVLLLALIERAPGPEATALVLEHYGDIPPGSNDGVALEPNALDRFGKELYEPAIAVLGDALRSPEEEVRGAAKQAFARFREYRQTIDEFEAWREGLGESQQTIDELVELLDSPNPLVVANAVKTLGALGARSAYPKLIRLLERDDPDIKAAVEQAVERLAQ